MCPHALRSRIGRGAILETVAVIEDPQPTHFSPLIGEETGFSCPNGPGCRPFARPPLTRMLTNEVISSLTICQVAQGQLRPETPVEEGLAVNRPCHSGCSRLATETAPGRTRHRPASAHSGEPFGRR
jgi:hypothetical protein